MKKDLKWDMETKRRRAIAKLNHLNEDQINILLIQPNINEIDILALRDDASVSDDVIRAILAYDESEMHFPEESEREALAEDFRNICGYSDEDAKIAAGNVLHYDHE